MSRPAELRIVVPGQPIAQPRHPERVRAASRLLDGRTFAVNDPHARAIATAMTLLEGATDD